VPRPEVEIAGSFRVTGRARRSKSVSRRAWLLLWWAWVVAIRRASRFPSAIITRSCTVLFLPFSRALRSFLSLSHSLAVGCTLALFVRVHLTQKWVARSTGGQRILLLRQAWVTRRIPALLSEQAQRKHSIRHVGCATAALAR
jgi:hypothetical protein